MTFKPGHAAILTHLEELRGIRVPCAGLAERGPAFGPGHVGRCYAATAPADRLDDETLTLAARELAHAPDPRGAGSPPRSCWRTTSTRRRTRPPSGWSGRAPKRCAPVWRWRRTRGCCRGHPGARTALRHPCRPGGPAACPSSGPGGPRPGRRVYAASKAAIRSLGRSWAAELVGRGVRINTIAPGPTETPGLLGLSPDEERLRAGLVATVPMNRLARPEETADVVVFLASDRSGFMTGAEVYVDGGASRL